MSPSGGEEEGSDFDTGTFGTYVATINGLINGPAVLDTYLSDATSGYVYLGS
jgi:hypothetical protein